MLVALLVFGTLKDSWIRLTGLTRAQYIRTVSLTDTTGEDIRIGTSIGPWWRIAGLQVVRGDC